MTDLGEQDRPDYFVSFTAADGPWAAWLVAKLGRAGSRLAGYQRLAARSSRGAAHRPPAQPS
jgi:hypothetical protein